MLSRSRLGARHDPAHIGRLTERFYRVDRSRSRDTGGTGLGLAIVKHSLQRHDAKLEIHSQLGAGATFSALFPANRLRSARACATSGRCGAQVGKLAAAARLLQTQEKRWPARPPFLFVCQQHFAQQENKKNSY